MDYCYTCRRTLNRVLVCPGCGAHAPDAELSAAAPDALDARFHGTYPVGGQPAAAQGEFAPTGYGPGSSVQDPYIPGPYIPAPLPPEFTPAAALAADEDDPAEPELGPDSVAPTLHRGRAARRRQTARWKKN